MPVNPATVSGVTLPPEVVAAVSAASSVAATVANPTNAVTQRLVADISAVAASLGVALPGPVTGAASVKTPDAWLGLSPPGSSTNTALVTGAVAGGLSALWVCIYLYWKCNRSRAAVADAGVLGGSSARGAVSFTGGSRAELISAVERQGKGGSGIYGAPSTSRGGHPSRSQIAPEPAYTYY